MNLAKHFPALLFGLLVLAGTFLLRISDPIQISSQRAAGFDSLQRLWPRSNEVPQPVRIVDIDEASLAQLGQWPWQRQTLAKLVQELSDLGAVAIVFDIVFPEADRMSPRHLATLPAYAGMFGKTDLATLADFDRDFATAMIGKPVVLAYAMGKGATSTTIPAKAGFAMTGANSILAPERIGKVTINLPILDAAAAGVGNINIDLANEQGVARQLSLLRTDGSRFYPSLVAEALRVAQGVDTFVVNGDSETENIIESLRIGDLEIPLAEDGTLYLHFRPDSRDMYVSAADVITGKEREHLRPLLEGHIVFIGTSAVGLVDARTSPLGVSIPGVSVHAQATEQILAGQFLVRPVYFVGFEYVMTALAGLISLTLASYAKPWTNILVTGAIALGIALLTIFLFLKQGMLLDAAFPLFSLGLIYLASTAFRLLVTDRHGRQMRNMFGHYVAPSVLAEIEKNPSGLKLGGEVRDVTVMFVDIANFTPLSEKLKPDELVQVVNGLWDVCANAVLAEKGTVDKFIGDAIMAFWNAPLPCDAHQKRAANAALRIREAVKIYNEHLPTKTLLMERGAWPISMRAGMASGPACVGNVGSKDRFDYTVLGETVNIAARAEGAGKQVEHDIVVAGKLAAETMGLAILPAGFVKLKGKTAREPLFIVVGDETEATSESFLKLAREHDQLVNLLKGPKARKNQQVARQLLDELAIHHQPLEKFMKALPGRIADFEPG